ncbi:unnamed protein product, partial [Prorocentrum cordatum]
GRPNDGGSNSSTEETDHEAEPAQAPAPSNGPTEESWAALGSIDLQQELRRFVSTLQNVPRFLRAETRMAFTTALKRIKRGPSGVRVEHLKPLLEHEEPMDLLGFAAAALAEFHACSARNTHYRDNVLMPSLTRANPAMLRSGSGPRAAYWLHTLPTTEGHVFKPARFLAALRRRLRLPLPLLPHTCGAAAHPGCRARLDTLGDHLAACPRTGLLARRAKPLERAWARVAREAGGRVVPQQLLRDTNAVLHNPLDRRQLDLVVYGISPNGVPLCCDSTMVSPLRRDGWHRPRTFDTDGAALLVAEKVGGRWGRDSLQLVRLLAKQKARAAPALLRRSAELAYTNRWWGFLNVAAQDSLMATLTGDGYLALGGAGGVRLSLRFLLAQRALPATRVRGGGEQRAAGRGGTDGAVRDRRHAVLSRVRLSRLGLGC